jgi:hypothetical protein
MVQGIKRDWIVRWCFSIIYNIVCLEARRTLTKQDLIVKRSKINSRGSKKGKSQDNHDQVFDYVFSYESHPWVAHSLY